jgi:hypothetical protein
MIAGQQAGAQALLHQIESGANVVTMRLTTVRPQSSARQPDHRRPRDRIVMPRATKNSVMEGRA